MWRTATAEQLAAITGLRTMLDGREMRPAFQAELVERGTLITELGWTGPARTGLAVVFVDAAPPDRGEQVTTDMWRGLRTQVARAAHQVPGSADRRVPQRMAAVRWQWWFPASRTASTAFGTLQAVRPTGTTGERWEPVHLLDPADLRAPAGTGDAAAVANCAALLGVPHWLRDRHPAVDLDRVLLRRAGITAPPKLLYLDRVTMRRTHPDPIGTRPPGRPRRDREA